MERYETMQMLDYDLISDIINTMFEVNEEIKSADNYIGEAMKLKPTAKEMADSKVAMSADELKHADGLTSTVNKMMEKLKAEKNPCYAVMAMFWHFMRENQAEWITKVKLKHEQYKK